MSEENLKINNDSNPTGLPPMRLIVPASVDVKKLVSTLNLSPTRSENLKNKIYYFLSRIVSTNDNYKLNRDTNGYRRVCSELMKKVLDNRDYPIIIDLLTDKNDPIIETPQSWHTSNPNMDNGYCRGYRLTPKYNTGEVVYEPIPPKFQSRITRHLPGDPDDIEINQGYQFLLNEFNRNPLSFDPRVYDFIGALGRELINRTGNNPYLIRMGHNHIGRWLYYVNRIETNDLWYRVSPDNYRLNSSITGLPKQLRPYLLCNGKPLVLVDVSSSQPYLLSSVMCNKFFTDTGAGYNLHTIYPELYDELVEKEYIHTNLDHTYSGSTPIRYDSTITSTGISDYYSTTFNNPDTLLYTSTSSSTPFMWCQFSTRELESIRWYQESPFGQDFYTYVIRSFNEGKGIVRVESYPHLRQKLKDSMMFVLFDRNYNHRNHNPYIRMFQSVFPGVNKWIEQVHRIISPERFSYLLQRTESYLLLNIVCREFHDQYPAAPVFTIHDAVLTDEEHHRELIRLVQERLKEITGIEVGVKTKMSVIDPELKPVDVDRVWKDISGITTGEKFVQVSAEVFSSNVERGSDFLKHPENFRKISPTVLTPIQGLGTRPVGREDTSENFIP